MAKQMHSAGSGPSQRQLRVGELIRRTLSDVLMRGDVHDPELTAMSITVGEVRTSPDLRVATAYVLPLHRNRAELRRLVSREVTLKFAPEIRYVIDESFDRMDRTRELLARDEVRRDLDAPGDGG